MQAVRVVVNLRRTPAASMEASLVARLAGGTDSTVNSAAIIVLSALAPWQFEVESNKRLYSTNSLLGSKQRRHALEHARVRARRRGGSERPGQREAAQHQQGTVGQLLTRHMMLRSTSRGS